MDLQAMNPDSGALRMSAYEAAVWDQLNQHWARRDNRRGIPNWVSVPAGRAGEAARNVTDRVVAAVPNGVKRKVGEAADKVAQHVAGPALAAAGSLLELVNNWVVELNDPKGVEKLARKSGMQIETFADLRQLDLKQCDRLLTANTLRWRTFGALEGGAMGALALVPVAGIPLAITADIVVIQALNLSIATRIAYSYGFDAKDPQEQEFIERLVSRSLMLQASKAKPLSDAARAANAARGRVRWSPKLRADHPLLVGIEKLMQQLGPAGARVPISTVAKVAPYVGILIGAGVNSTILGNVAAEAKKYSQTRFLCEKYDLPLPLALRATVEDGPTVVAGDKGA